MTDEANKKILLLTIITGRSKKDAILTALLESDIHLINTVYAKGSVNAGYLRSVFGLVPEADKVVIICVSTYAKIESVLEIIDEKFDFNKPNTGIAFSLPVEGVSY